MGYTVVSNYFRLKHAMLGAAAQSDVAAPPSLHDQYDALVGTVTPDGEVITPDVAGAILGITPYDVAGQYTAICINLGVGYTWDPHSPQTCPGYLDVYISGTHVAHINTGGSGGGPLTWTCILGVGLGMVTLFAPGGLEIGWATSGTLTGLGLTLLGCAGY